MKEITNVEEHLLNQAVESGKEVTIITINGYQASAVIISFDSNVIEARVKSGKTWMVYRHAVSTIVMD